MSWVRSVLGPKCPYTSGLYKIANLSLNLTLTLTLTLILTLTPSVTLILAIVWSPLCALLHQTRRTVQKVRILRVAN